MIEAIFGFVVCTAFIIWLLSQYRGEPRFKRNPEYVSVGFGWIGI